MGNVYFVKTWRGPTHYYEFRKDPVPGIHKRRGISGFRHVKTFQEMKLSFAEPGLVRAARRKPNLPTLWDDNIRSDGFVKSWKHCTRKPKQWM